MIHPVTVVSLGPGDPDLLNLKTVRTLKEAKALILLTDRHQTAGWLKQEGITFESLDRIFESAEDFDVLHRAAADFVLKKAETCPVVFAVPDACSDMTVRALSRSVPDPSLVTAVPGTGYYDVFLSQALDTVPDSDIRVASASDFLSGAYDPGKPLLILEIDSEILAGQLKLRLSDYQEDESEILLLRIGALPSRIPLYELDRQASYNPQTAAVIPATDYLHRDRFVLQDLILIMEKLLSPEGCPWDREQTHRSLRPYLAEEAWECIASIDQEDMEHLPDELGDLLLQIVFHSCIGKQYDEFTMDDVVSAICRKMIRRHPHVFAGMSPQEAQQIPGFWEKLKQAETGHRGVIDSLEDVSSSLPSLKYSGKLFKKLSVLPAFQRTPARIAEEMRRMLSQEGPISGRNPEESAGLLLLLASELCFRLGLDAELLLHQAADRLKERMKEEEICGKKCGKSIESLTFSELGVYLKHVEGEIE